MIVHEHALSSLQQGMLFQSLALPGEAAYLLQMTFDLRENINPPLFWRAWEKVAARHTILRSSVRLGRGRFSSH